MLDANSIAALLPPPDNAPIGNAPSVIDDSRVTFPTTGEFLNYDAATLPPGQQPTWTPTPTSTTPASTPASVPAVTKTVIDFGTERSSGSSGILWIGVAAMIICVLLAAAYWFLGRRGNATSSSAADAMYQY